MSVARSAASAKSPEKKPDRRPTRHIPRSRFRPDDWLTVGQSAAILGAGPRFVYGLIRDGKLKAIKLNVRGDLRIRCRWLDETMEQIAAEQLGDRHDDEPIVAAAQ